MFTAFQREGGLAWGRCHLLIDRSAAEKSQAPSKQLLTFLRHLCQMCVPPAHPTNPATYKGVNGPGEGGGVWVGGVRRRSPASSSRCFSLPGLQVASRREQGSKHLHLRVVTSSRSRGLWSPPLTRTSGAPQLMNARWLLPLDADEFCSQIAIGRRRSEAVC